MEKISSMQTTQSQICNQGRFKICYVLTAKLKASIENQNRLLVIQ